MKLNREKPIPSVQLSIRLKPDVLKMLQTMARNEGVFPAQVVSRLIQAEHQPSKSKKTG